MLREQIHAHLMGKPCVYILRLKNDALYVGFSSRLPIRIWQHTNGRGARVVNHFGVEWVEWVRECASVEEAKWLEQDWVAQYRKLGVPVYGGGYCRF